MRISRLLVLIAILANAVFIVFLVSAIKDRSIDFSKFWRRESKQKVSLNDETPTVRGEKSEALVLVVKVVDGDTITLEGGEKVRYIGINAPEKNDCYILESSEFNKRLVESKTVRLEKDLSERDRFNRLLRYVWIEDVFVNDYLVREGYARVATYPPDVKYNEQLLEAEREARENLRGLWANCL